MAMTKDDIRFIYFNEMPSSSWSGGSTTQVCIFPEGAELKERDFVFRISTATIECPESQFSDFSGYERILFSLDGIFRLSNAQGKDVVLKPGEKYHFSGSDKIISRGEGQDFNLIFRKGVQACAEYRLMTTEEIYLEKDVFHCIFPVSQGSDLVITLGDERLSGGVLIKKPGPGSLKISLSGQGSFIHSRIII